MQSTVIKPWNTIQQAIRFQRFDLFGTLKLFSAFNWALAIVITLSASPLWAQMADIRTVLGAAGFSGGYEDGIGTAARFNSPTSIAFNNVGSAPSLMYVADTGNHRIRAVSLATLQVVTIAGAGVAGWADGVGTAARFNSPTDLAVDSSNTYLYVTDKENGAIRKINIATKAVTTIIGKSCTSNSSYCNGQSGCCTNNLITGGTSTISYPYSYSPGSGIYASFSIPYKMKLSYSAPASSSAGALWVTDLLGTLSVVDLSSSPATMYMAACIDPSGGGCVSCTSTGGCAAYSNQTLTGVELDSNSPPNILVSVSNDQSIWQCIPGGTLATLASCSRAIGTGDSWTTVDFGDQYGYWSDEIISDPLSARLSNPDGLFFDAASSSLYVADTGNHAIRQVNYVLGAPNNVVTIAGQGTIAQNNSDPDNFGYYVGAGQRITSPPTCGVTDPFGGALCGDPSGAGAQDGTAATFNNPRGVGFVDATNQLWVVDTNNHTIRVSVGTANAIRSTLSPASASITANGSITQVLTVQAKDSYGNNLSTGGATVTITRSSGTGTIGAVTNNNDGTYSATVTSPVATGSGVFVATLNSAAVKSNSGTQTQATLSYVVDTASISTSSISASPASITADGSSTSTITVQLKDANGNNLSSSGGTVSLSSTAGTLSSVTNNNNGTYSATLTSATTAGSATITGQLAASALSSTASVTFIAGSANQLVFTSIPQTIAVSAVSGTMNVQLQDNHGNPVYAGVNGLTVNLSSNTTGTATFYQTDGITPISNITIASIGNTASFKYKDTQIGTPTINVSANGLSSATQQVTVSIGAADAAQSTLTPSTASITANGSSTQVLTVQAKDASGNNLSTGGESITITKLTGTGTISAVNDNSNGTYTATVTSASNAGSGVFVATLGGTVVKSGSSNQTQSIVNYFAAVITPPAPPPSISAGSTTTISNLGSYAPVISGGTLILNKDDNTSTSLTVASAGGTIKNPTIGSATLSGALTGTGGLTFTGAGTTVLTGANTYTGGTTVASGTLQGNTNSLQGNVTNNGTVVFDQANTGNFSGTITGTGKLVIQNTGTLILTGNNNYSGGTTVNSGSSLSISSGSSLGTGTLDLLGSSTLFTTGDTFITIDIAVSGH